MKNFFKLNELKELLIDKPGWKIPLFSFLFSIVSTLIVGFLFIAGIVLAFNGDSCGDIPTSSTILIILSVIAVALSYVYIYSATIYSYYQLIANGDITLNDFLKYGVKGLPKMLLSFVLYTIPIAIFVGPFLFSGIENPDFYSFSMFVTVFISGLLMPLLHLTYFEGNVVKHYFSFVRHHFLLVLVISIINLAFAFVGGPVAFIFQFVSPLIVILTFSEKN